MKREPGFYWVKYRDMWVVAFYDEWEWSLPRYKFGIKEIDLEAIHETRLIPPEETTSRKAAKG